MHAPAGLRALAAMHAPAGLRTLAAMMALAAVLSAPQLARADHVTSALSCLAAEQNEDGSWGQASGTALRDTAVVVSALRAVGQGTSSQAVDGRAALLGQDAANTDYLARQITAGSGAGAATGLVDDLLAEQLASSPFPDEPNFPEGGWGVADGFGTDTLTTALALNAIRASGAPAGLAVADAVVQAGATNTHSFVFPAGGSGLTLLVRKVTGSVRLFLDTPSSGSPFLDLSNVSVPTPIGGIPQQTGTYGIRVQSLSGGPNTYSFEIGFSAGGFDAGRITRAVVYLGVAQNDDGSWGLRRGQAGLVMITAEVLQTLLGFGDSIVAPAMVADGLDYLQSHQNEDGGFGQTTSTVYETALALLAFRAAEGDEGVIDDAVAYLGAQQQDDGCWNDDAYATALAMSAIFLPDDGLFCNGLEVCDLVEGCSVVDVPDCNDDVPCTIDACVEATDACSHVDDDSVCSDNLFCNGDETCQGALGCVDAEPDYVPDCDDGLDCTVDACVELTDTCSHVADHGACDDGQFCTADSCSTSEGCVAPPRNCADAVACTTDGCDEAADICTHVANDAACADANVCSDDTCNVATGCLHPPNSAPCDDGNECTIDDACAALTCTGTPDPKCATTTTTLPEQPLCGDFNGSGTLTAQDALGALRAAVGSLTCAVAICDFNGNGSVTAQDALAILKKAVGIDLTPNCPVIAAADQASTTTTTTVTTTSTLP
ncbi:MAG TPA: prenyltransferase/squalene oxidase repeat-containing protein [Candidatus Binatia bacterium]|nr:prenyltransferase/squalene oxidase repeat-containing protein [Candidatus Binatia bacterium]